MSKIAIDIVLLPDEGISKLCKDLNRNLSKKIDFNNTGKIPHISLFMGIIEESQLEKVQNILTNIAKKYSLFTGTGIFSEKIFVVTGENINYFELEKDNNIKNLFLDIYKEIKPILTYDNLSKDMFYKPEEVGEQSFVYIKGFKNKTIDEYSSHITLGIGKLTGDLPNMIHFNIPKLAIYQLGNCCTCENKLFEINL